jgi:hypothetical protein
MSTQIEPSAGRRRRARIVPEPYGRRLISDLTFRAKLGGISRATLWRLRHEDERCPQPVKLLGQNRTDEGEADVYIEQLLEDRSPP